MILRRPDSSSLSTAAQAATALLFDLSIRRFAFDCGHLQPERPRRPSTCLTAQETGRLHKAVVSGSGACIRCWLNPAPDFRDPLPAVKRIDNRESNAGEKTEPRRSRFRAFAGAPGRNCPKSWRVRLSLDEAMKNCRGRCAAFTAICQKHLEQAEGKVEILLRRRARDGSGTVHPEAEEES